ncbi:MAG: SRPBCC family protein [Patescibacteria group bacterium]|nr:SRPBCC family protein [Patescibacteria group bacterium]
MISLKDSIEIKATPEKVFNWFKNMDNKSFTEWHPNHKKFVRVTGGMEEGDIVYAEECVSEIWYKLKLKITKIEKGIKGWRVELKNLRAPSRIIFIAEAKEDGCIFTHIETWGYKTPIVSNIVDFLVKVLFRKRIDIVQRDIEEDDENLKELLEGAH